MVAISKQLFYEKLDIRLPCTLFHPWTESCAKGLLRYFASATIGSSKFFLPIYVAQALLSYVRTKKINIKHLLRSYIRSILYGACFVTTFFGSNCLLRWLTNGIYYYNIVLVAGFMAGLNIFIESKSNRYLNTLYFINLVIESSIYKLTDLGLVQRSRLKDTFAFMVSNGMLMYLFKTQPMKPYDNLWFYPPPHKYGVDDKKMRRLCKHKDTCTKYFQHGFVKYFAVGYLVEIMKSLIGKFGQIFKNPTSIWKLLFNKDNVLFGLVTGCYVLFFRMITCFLLKTDGTEHNYHSVLAGFVSASTYYIKPNLQFGIISCTTIIQLLIQRLGQVVPYPRNSLETVFAVCTAILLQARFMFPHLCPTYIKTMVRLASNGSDKLFLDFIKVIFL